MRRVVSLFVLMLAAEMGIWSLGKVDFHTDRRVLGETTGSIDARVAALERRVYQLEKNAGLIKSKSNTNVSKESFVTLNGGSVEGYDWTKLSGSDFTFDLSLYANGIVTWEGWMDNGLGSVRIYDDTNHRAVDGSEVMITSGKKSSFYSKPLSIWRGQNTYHLEIKSLSGQVMITESRLKVVVR